MGSAVLQLHMPSELRERVRRISKRTRLSASHIARDGLTERVEYYEAKERADKERRRRDPNERGLRGLDERQPLDRRTAKSADTDNPIHSLYLTHARRLFEVIDDPNAVHEKRIRLNDAITAIKRQCPLTYPSDGEIMAYLERLIVELRVEAADGEEQPEPVDATAAVPDFTRRSIDLSKVKTFGDAKP